MNNNHSPAPSHHHHHRDSQHRSYSVEAAQAQAQNQLSPFAQRLAKKMNQTLQFEKLPDTFQQNQEDGMYDRELGIDGLLSASQNEGGGANQFGFSSILGPLVRDSNSQLQQQTSGRRGNTNNNNRTPNRGQSPSIVRSHTSLSYRSNSASNSVRMRIGAFTVNYNEPTGDLHNRLKMGVAARREEINRRQLSRLHRPTAAGSFAEVDPVEPRVQEPGLPDNVHRKPAQLVVTTSVTRSRTPLRTMTRQDWEDQRRQHSFSQELRRHSCEVTKRSIAQNAAPYINKHRGVDHTYLSEGAKWFTKPSPRLGFPCKITLASNEYGPSPGPGSYNVPSSFLGR
jgi:hypothetical protein